MSINKYYWCHFHLLRQVMKMGVVWERTCKTNRAWEWLVLHSMPFMPLSDSVRSLAGILPIGLFIRSPWCLQQTGKPSVIQTNKTHTDSLTDWGLTEDKPQVSPFKKHNGINSFSKGKNHTTKEQVLESKRATSRRQKGKFWKTLDVTLTNPGFTLQFYGFISWFDLHLFCEFPVSHYKLW